MAFFLLLWLISMTTDEQKKGLADYFAPPNVSETTSGAGGVLAGTALDNNGAKQTPETPDPTRNTLSTAPSPQDGYPELARGPLDTPAVDQPDKTKASPADLSSHFDQEFHAAAASVRQAWEALPNVTDIAQNLLVQETKEGLEIVIADQNGRPMFPAGSKYPYEATRKAIAVLAPVLRQLTNPITISGYVAAGGSYPDASYGPWELSSDRANVVRAILGEYGLPDDHIAAVSGKSTTQPFFPDDPYLASNERVEIVVQHLPPPVPPDLTP
jgi:chemotaxis protein MotB